MQSSSCSIQRGVMKIIGVIIFVVASIVGCSKPQTPSLPVSDELSIAQNISIQKSSDGLEGSIKVEQDWLGDKYGPIRFVCEASSIERLLTFVAKSSGKPVDEIRGKELLPKGTYRYSFKSKTWQDRGDLFKDVMKATEEAFGLILEISHDQAGTILTVKMKPKDTHN